jgi:hypothetical protein
MISLSSEWNYTRRGKIKYGSSSHSSVTLFDTLKSLCICDIFLLIIYDFQLQGGIPSRVRPLATGANQVEGTSGKLFLSHAIQISF